MNVNIVFTGHVDHGKSTLIGRLLYDSESIKEDRVAEIQKLVEEYKRRFEFAYFLDSFQDELEEERTIDTTRVIFKGRNYYTIVDVPGHREFIKNMLSGASHADAAVLVVSAPDGVQEQTRRHAFLLRLLGIEKILVAVNKMDLVDYMEEVYHRVSQETGQLLSSFGYTEVAFIPLSALEGDNVFKTSQRMAWYKGPTLIEALDEAEPGIVEEKPLRFVVQDVYALDYEKVIVGRVESGTLGKGAEIIFQPSNIRARVESIKAFPDEMEQAVAGDSVGIVTGDEAERGDVAGTQDAPPLPVTEFLVEVVLLDGTLRQEEALELKCGTRRAKCRVKDIRERISSESGEVIEMKPAEIGENEAATLTLETEPLVVEKFSEMPELGRFVLVRNDKNVGAGVILEVDR